MEVEKLSKKHEPIPLSLDIDRIRHLPRTLLLHMLSFLPTESAVQTCVLSRRWRYLWIYIPVLDLDIIWFPVLTNESRKRNQGTGRETEFDNFVDKVLMLRDGSDLHKFRLCCDNCDFTCSADTWVCSAIGRNVRELDLSISVKGAFEIPRWVFTSASLASVKLILSCDVLKLPTGIGFCSLKNLHLQTFRHKGEFQNLELFSNCPQLEYLEIRDCKLKILNIFALKLKTLIIEDRWSRIKKFKVSAPSLVSFKYIGKLANEYDVENLSSLAHAELEFTECYSEKAGMHMSSFIQGLYKAETLTLSGTCITLLSKAPNVSEILPTQNYDLKLLKLTAMLGKFDNIQVIACLLKHYINLETLVIDGIKLYQDMSETMSHSGFPFECPLDRLKEVEIRCFEGCEYELQFVKFLLMNAKVLEKMIIYTSGNGWKDFKKRRGFNRKLLAFPMASSSIKILLY